MCKILINSVLLSERKFLTKAVHFSGTPDILTVQLWSVGAWVTFDVCVCSFLSFHFFVYI